MRKRAFLDADDEHEAELKALGRMQGHQAHRIAWIVAIVVREQGQLRGEITRSAFLLHGAEPVSEFLEVLHASRTRARFADLCGNVLGVADARDQGIHQFGGRQVLGALSQFADQLDKAGQRTRRSWRQAGKHVVVLGCPQHRLMARTGCLAQFLQ